MPEISAAASLHGAIQLQHLGPLSSGTRAALGVELTARQAAAFTSRMSSASPLNLLLPLPHAGWMNLLPVVWVDTLMTGKNAKMECVDVSLSKPFCFLSRGALVFASTSSLGTIAVMIVFSAFVQAATGDLQRYCAYVDPAVLDPTAGIVGASVALVFVSSNRIRQLDYCSRPLSLWVRPL
jgi:hypothetical protein